jgi:outer membrane murein-binding lipoprotein Lpp
MVRALALAFVLLAGCSEQTHEANAAEAEEHAQQALQEVTELSDRLDNIENEQNEIDTNVQELVATASTHDEKIDDLETQSR